MTTRLPNINPRGRPPRDSYNEIPAQKDHEEVRAATTGHIGKQEYISPFRLPNDDEVFVFRELERKKREEFKHLSQDLKIWDKKIGTSARPLRLFKNFDPSNKENAKGHVSVGYTTKEKAVIVEAQRIINERRRSRDTNGKEQKEGVVELLERKKEMFLVEMTVGMIEQEKETLVNKASEKEEALKKSDDMLEKDWREFESYKQNNKQETDQAIQRHNQEMDHRKRTELEYKIKNNDLTSLKAEKTKNEELMQKYLDAKNFLDRLTPKELLEERENEFKEKIEEIKAQWMEREQLGKEESFSVLSESNTRIPTKEKRYIGKKNSKYDIDKIFQDKLDKGEFDEIEEFRLNQNIYFQDPDQLIEIFARLEEGNLALIQMMQDTEQNLENLKFNLKQKKIEFDKKIGGLRDNKSLLEKNKHEKEDKVKQLEFLSKEPRLSKKNDGLAPLRKKIIEIVNLFKEDTKGNIDQEALSTLDHLANIELNLEKLLEKLNEYKPSKVVEWKRHFEDIRKRANRKHQLEREQKLAEEKSRKASERALEKSKKRSGRLDMAKSIPLAKKEVVTHVVKTSEEEEDMKYFKPYLAKF